MSAAAERLTSTERLLQDLAARAQAEADTVLAAARDEAARLRAEAGARCEEARANALDACDAELAAGRAARLADARSATRRALLETQHAAIRRVLDEVPRVAAVLAAAARAPDAIVAARVAQLLAYLDEPAELRCAPVLVEQVTAAVPNGAAMRICPDPAIVVGVRAAAASGRVVVDDTLDAWLTREAPALRIEICRALGADDA